MCIVRFLAHTYHSMMLESCPGTSGLRNPSLEALPCNSNQLLEKPESDHPHLGRSMIPKLKHT